MDLIDDPTEGQNAPEFTVSEISGAVKKTLEGAFGRVRIRGELGRVVIARSGHIYFDIKDDRNVLACTTWKGQAARLSVRPEEGMEVVVAGKLSTFGPQSKYNLNVDEMTVAGEGALLAMLEKRKVALQAEGLFDPSRKKPLPYLPDVIGVITSPTGAVIRDILHRLRDRFPRKVLIWPVAVQGKSCAPEVANAIKGFNQMTVGGALPRPDLLIVARGGGAIEDLWGFNEEIVARAAAASDIPLISAVGHETDTTLIDFVSDRRAPTPTAAAEMAVPVRLDLMAWLDEQDARLSRALTTSITRRQQRLHDMGRILGRPDTLTNAARQRFDLWDTRLPKALTQAIARKNLALLESAGALKPTLLTRGLKDDARRVADRAARLGPALQRRVDMNARNLRTVSDRLRADVIQRDLTRKSSDLARISVRLVDLSQKRLDQARNQVAALDRLHETLGYKRTLDRGYAVVRASGVVVTTQKQAAKATELEIEFADGTLRTGETAIATKPLSKAKPKPKSDPENQGSLF